MWKSTLNRSGILSKYCSSTLTFKMKSLIVLLLFSVSITLFANTWGDYEYTDNGYEITITNYTGDGGDITIPSEINGKPVVEIGDYAFEERTSLKSVTIPNSVTSIGGSAFSNCSSLTSVTIPDSVTSIGGSAFSNCSSLTSVTIPDSVTSIGNWAFYNCTSLTSITIPDSVTSIEIATFYHCTSLTSVTIGNNVTSIGDMAFRDCTSLTSITIPDSVTSIEDHAFIDCTSLTSVTIGNSVTSIGDIAFYDCTSLTSITVDATNLDYSSINGVLFDKDQTTLIQYPAGKSEVSYTIPTSVTSIEDYAFCYCTSMTSVTIGNSVTSIGNSAFVSCTSMTSIIIDVANPNYSSLNGVLFNKDQTTLIQYPAGKSEISYIVPTSVITIGFEAFSYCTSLTSITIGNSMTTIGRRAFYDCTSLTSITVDVANPNYSSLNGVLFNKDQTTLIQYPAGKSETSYTIPTSVMSIGDWAFASCTNLTSITIPDSVTSIGDYAFRSCSSLTSVTIGNSVTSIESYAFYDCSSLTSVTIPNNVTSIGYHAFDHCTSLTTAIFLGDAPDSFSFGDGVFDYCASGFTIYYHTDATGFSSPTWNGYPCEELPGCHSADTDSNWSISQNEVNSFIANYANNNNTVSTASGDITPGRITMREVLRVIYLYNNGGAYKVSGGTIDKYDIAEVEESVEALPPTTTSSETNHTLVCANSADSGAGSLRDAIANATYGDTITFDESLKKITLASEIVIDKSITIDGNGVTIVSGSGKMRIFRIYNENEDLFVTLLNMGIVDANNSSDKFGGAIYNNGESLTLENCLLNNNANIVEDGKGGAIYSSGTLTVNNCEFTDNFASEESDVYSTDD